MSEHVGGNAVSEEEVLALWRFDYYGLLSPREYTPEQARDLLASLSQKGLLQRTKGKKNFYGITPAGRHAMTLGRKPEAAGG